MNQVQIEKGIVCPPPQRASKYPFKTMEVGDSFFVPVTVAKAASIANGGKKALKAVGAKFSIRSVVENEVSGTRIWRVA